MSIKAVLFDLDDTLLQQTAPPDWDLVTSLQVEAWAPHCERLGFGAPAAADVIRAFWAEFAARHPERDASADVSLEELRWCGGAELVRETLAVRGIGCGRDDADVLWDALSIPEPHFNHRLYADAVGTVEALSAAGYQLAVVTDRPARGAVQARLLRELGLPGLFAAVVTTGDVTYRKPHPRVFESALGQLGVAPDQALFVGNSYEHDIIPAAAAGMVPVLKLNARDADSRWTLARHQVPSLAGLLSLDILSTA